MQCRQPLTREPPASDTVSRKGSKPETAETRQRLGSREPGPRLADAHKQKNPLTLESEDLDFLARIGLRVIDPDLKHGKTLLEFFSTCPCAILGCKFGFQSAIHFERVTRGRQFTIGCNHFIPIVQ